MDFGKIVARIKGVLISPKAEWPVIASEPATIGGLYSGYIVLVAALPVIASFIKSSLIGYSGWGVHMHTPIGMGLVGMLTHYILSLVVTYVVALIVNALAPTFGGQKDMVQALKTVAYSWTAAWVAGIAVLIPFLGWLVMIAGLVYAIYLLYLGLPQTMRCPPDKAGGYTAVSVIIAIVLTWIIALIVGGIIGTAALSGGSMGAMHIKGSDGTEVTLDASKLAAVGERAQQASKELEAAQKSGDTAAQQAAMGKMMGADSHVQSIAPDIIKALLPDSVDGLKRTNLSAARNNAMGVQLTTAKAQYSDDQGHSVELEVADTGSMRGMMAMASAMAPETENQTDHGYDKTYTTNGRLFHEAWDNNAKSGEYGVVVAQRFSVKASGNPDNIDALKKAVNSVDLDKLESLKNEGATAN